MQLSSNQSYQSLKPADRLQQLLPELFTSQTIEGEQFLRLQLTSELTVAIPLSWVEETLLVSPQQITPIPNMSSHVMGLMSSKGQVFWAINLLQLLNLPIALPSSQHYEVVVIRVLPLEPVTNIASEQLFLGLVVPKIRGSIRLTLEDIVSPETEIDINLLRYLSGQVVVDQQTILVLSAEVIGTSQHPALDR
ncbi:MAG: chemotaxis protein CheW [Cyanobacteria bacterium P01_D01_bin.156]